MVELLPLFGFVFFGLFSPGPNVILLTASGARFGFRATVPHILGVAVGVGVIAGLVGLGLGALLHRFPSLAIALKVAACLWILWMAVNLWRAKTAKQKAAGDKPFTFLQAVLFQWVNPKIWAVALSAVAYVATLPAGNQAGILALTFSCINLGVCLFWAWAGSLLSLLLSQPLAWLIFMRIMAVALAGFPLAVFL